MIKTASIIPGDSIQELPRQHSSRVWAVRAVAQGRVFRGYFKWVPMNQLASEVVCGYLGRTIGLNVPVFYIARPDPSMQDPTGALPPIGFLSSEKRFHVFNQWGTGEQRVNTLPAWTGFRPTAVFDEWVANVDRRFHNLLFDPTDRDFWLIDHGHAFTGNDWEITDLIPDGQWTNMLMAMEKSLHGTSDLGKWISATTDLLAAAGRIDLDEVAARCNAIPGIQTYVTPACRFLSDRRFKVRPLIERRISGQQQLAYP